MNDFTLDGVFSYEKESLLPWSPSPWPLSVSMAEAAVLVLPLEGGEDAVFVFPLRRIPVLVGTVPSPPP